MIRDPSDGSVREKPVTGIPTAPVTNSHTSILEPASGLPPTSSKAAYLERLEESRKWLNDYFKPKEIT